MFYLKYRPRNLEELDNSQVRLALQNLLKAKEFPHALLFVGQRGMGKTSVARIFAALANQTDWASIDGSPDVVEMDAASNRGIDEIKRLISEASFVPTQLKYRVFIIDEAHMITTEAFNALLKTLEEPPKSTIFILATTNEEKLPKTIISRCYRINFGKANKLDLINMLKRIVKAEQVEISDELLEFIASHCDNSFREGAKILEDLILQNKLEVESARAYLGASDYNELLQIISERSLQEALEWCNNFAQSNLSVKQLITNLLLELQNLLLANNNIKLEKVLVQVKLSNKQIAGLMRLLMDSNALLKVAPIEIIALEVALVDFYAKFRD